MRHPSTRTEDVIDRAQREPPGAPWSAALGRPTLLVTAAAALLVVAAATWGVTGAGFSGATAPGSSSWQAGTVAFGANSPTTALFTVTGAQAGSFGSSCVTVSYTGTVDARVRLYVGAGGVTGTGLGTYLSLQVNEGTGTSSDCSDFVRTAIDYSSTGISDYTKTLATFAAGSTDFASGVSAWSPTGSATRTFQLVYFVQPTNAAVGLSANASFTWEAQS